VREPACKRFAAHPRPRAPRPGRAARTDPEGPSLFRTALTDLVGDRTKSLAAFVDGHGKSLAAFADGHGKSLAAFAEGHGKSLAAFAGDHTRSLAYVGAAVALTGIGTATATAATSSPGPATSIVGAARNADVADNAGVQHGRAITAVHKAATHSSSKNTTAKKTAGKSTARKASAEPAAHTHTHSHSHSHANAQPKAVTREASKSRVHVVKHHAASWRQIRDAVAADTLPKAAPGKLPLADRLLPGPTSGSQAYLPLTASRMANATTIVRQALAKHMGLRSAVIAIATSEQEATLENINYGDRDSLGLFQQRPSAGWGSPAQVTDPVYAADAFLNALHAHQAADPAWASQPLWANAQAVQDSAYPYAYAKWEAQAAQIVAQVTKQIS
jgi:hypothetical protein